MGQKRTCNLTFPKAKWAWGIKEFLSICFNVFKEKFWLGTIRTALTFIQASNYITYDWHHNFHSQVQGCSPSQVGWDVFHLTLHSVSQLHVLYINFLIVITCLTLDWVPNGGWMIGSSWLTGGGLAENWLLISYFPGPGTACNWRRVTNYFLVDFSNTETTK